MPPRSTTRSRAFDRALVTTFAGAGRGAAAHHAVPGAVRPGAAQAHLATASRRSAPARPSGSKAHFPVEIAPLARETNALIDANREIVERARTHVGNLAHALKTPLSVMINEATARGDDPLAAKVARADRHHARSGDAPSRARAARGARRGGRHRHRRRAGGAGAGAHDGEDPSRQATSPSSSTCRPRRAFRGERQDLEEMVGNLVDNACKWASSRVAIEVMLEQPEPGAAGGAHRGRRRRAGADAGGARAGRHGAAGGSTRPSRARGSACRSWSSWPALYGGALKLGTAPIGGLRAELVLPAG